MTAEKIAELKELGQAVAPLHYSIMGLGELCGCFYIGVYGNSFVQQLEDFCCALVTKTLPKILLAEVKKEIAAEKPDCGYIANCLQHLDVTFDNRTRDSKETAALRDLSPRAGKVIVNALKPEIDKEVARLQTLALDHLKDFLKTCEI